MKFNLSARFLTQARFRIFQILPTSPNPSFTCSHPQYIFIACWGGEIEKEAGAR